MRRIIFLIILNISFTLSYSFAGAVTLLTGPQWEGKSNSEITRTMYEEAFPTLYQITESDVNSERVLYAFFKMKVLISANGLDNKHRNNEIQSAELKTLLGELIATTQNPQTAKDYFYKGLFSYPSYPSMEVSGMFSSFDYVINNFPDTIYAKYSYLLLAGNHSYAGKRYAESNNLLNNYITKYGESDPLISTVYNKLADNYYNLYLDTPKTNVQEKQNYGKLMLTYSDKILNDFPGNTNMVAWVQFNLAHYYKLEGNNAESISYYNQIYNNPNGSEGLISASLNRIYINYVKQRDYQKAGTLLEDAKSRYFNMKNIRKEYKDKKQHLEEIRVFGYDKYDRFSAASKQIYEQNKAAIDAYRQQYEASWDADFNLIAPLPVPAQ